MVSRLFFKLKNLAHILKNFFVRLLASPGRYLQRLFIKKRLTLIFGLLSIIFLAIVLIRILTIFNFSEPSTSIHVIPQSDNSSIESTIFVKYNPDGDDSVTLFLSGPEDELRQFSTLKILVSDNLSRVESFETTGAVFDGVIQEPAGKTYWYRFTSPGSFSMSEEFAGNIFGSSQRNINLQFIYSTSEVIEESIDTVYLFNLQDVDILTLNPLPDDIRSSGVYTYQHWETDPFGFRQSIRLRGIDNSAVISEDLELVMLSVMAGIISSFLASILLDIIHFFEAEKDKI